MDSLIKDGILPDNRTELFRRGLHCCNILARIDESELISELIDPVLETLSLPDDDKDGMLTMAGINYNIKKAASLAELIYSVLVAKRGIEHADIFVRIINEISMIEQEFDRYVRQKKLMNSDQQVAKPDSIRTSANNLKSAISLIFPSPKQ